MWNQALSRVLVVMVAERMGWSAQVGYQGTSVIVGCHCSTEPKQKEVTASVRPRGRINGVRPYQWGMTVMYKVLRSSTCQIQKSKTGSFHSARSCCAVICDGSSNNFLIFLSGIAPIFGLSWRPRSSPGTSFALLGATDLMNA